MVGLVKDLVAVGVNPFEGLVFGVSHLGLLVQVVPWLPLQLVQSEESEDEDEHAEVYKKTDKEQRVGVPLENIVHILIDYEAVHQREETAQRRDVDDPLDDGDFGGGRQLLLD